MNNGETWWNNVKKMRNYCKLGLNGSIYSKWQVNASNISKEWENMETYCVWKHWETTGNLGKHGNTWENYRKPCSIKSKSQCLVSVFFCVCCIISFFECFWYFMIFLFFVCFFSFFSHVPGYFRKQLQETIWENITPIKSKNKKYILTYSYYILYYYYTIIYIYIFWNQLKSYILTYYKII